MGMAEFREPLPADVSLQLAIRAHAGTSHTPERRGESEIADYVHTIRTFNEALAESADTDERMAEAVAQSDRFREGYVKRLNSVLSTRSRMMSTMITGPANFPVRQQEKVWRSYDKKMSEFIDWQQRAQRAALKSVASVGVIPEPKPDGAKTGTETKKIGSVEIVTNHDIERIQIVFDGKPSADIISKLKGAAWNWSPRNSAWQRKITNNAMWSAERIAAKVAA
jgi:hypothetical protein